MLKQLIDILMPRRCILCGGALSYDSSVMCPTCRKAAPLITYQSYEDNEMCRLFWHMLPVVRAGAMYRYKSGTPWRRLVTMGKFGGRHDVLVDMGRQLGRHFMQGGFFDSVDALVAMPSTRLHVWQRGYNQAELIARGVSKATGLPLLTGVAKRTDDNRSQLHRSRLERKLSLRNAFSLIRPEAVAGRHIALIDDVCTTGASLLALGEAINKAPDVKISILTLMRTSLL